MESRGLLSRRNLLKLGGAAASATLLGLAHRQSFADPDFRDVQRYTGPTPKKGGVFRLRLDQAPVHFDPHQTAARATMVPLSLAYSRLVRVKVGPGVAPGTLPVDTDIAESWDSQGGGTIYVFRLRRGVTWHNKPPVNGRELTAEDVKYTFDRFLTTKGNPNRALLDMVDKIETADRYTVKFTLKEPNVWFPDRLASTSTWIVAKECVEKYGDLKRWESVVGTGPWALERYEPNTKLHFTRHSSYTFQGFPYADAVEMTIDPDPAAAFAAFAAGKYDFAPEYGMVIRRADLSVAKQKISRWLPTKEYLVPAGAITAMKLDQDPFKDVRVRRAIATADNWREVLEHNPLAQGKGAPNPAIPAALKDWSIPIKKLPPDGQKLYEADPGAVRQLLSAAGHASGLKIPVETGQEYGPAWMEMVQATVKNWKAAGIEADLKVKEYDGKFDKMLLIPRDGGTATDPEFYFSQLLPGDPLNTAGVNDPKLTEMIKLQRRTTKESQRRDILYDIQRHCAEQVYYAYGASVGVVSAWMPHVEDFAPNIGHDYGGRLTVAWINK